PWFTKPVLPIEQLFVGNIAHSRRLRESPQRREFASYGRNTESRRCSTSEVQQISTGSCDRHGYHLLQEPDANCGRNLATARSMINKAQFYPSTSRRVSCPPFGMALRALMARFKMAAVNKVRSTRTNSCDVLSTQLKEPAMALSRVQVSVLGLGAAV